ncbi:Lactoylglutathione lyase [Minicystis rosea]|nr:Lactoylglutathione lyase [Minicystis rosea]
MIDHVVITVSDLARSASFYERALAPLGHVNVVTYDGHPGHAALHGFGDDGETYLMLKHGTPAPQAAHVAFAARSKSTVDAFHRAALAAGGRDNGPPGPRRHYFSGYYAAYVLDPDGYNIEAVYQRR